MRDFVLTKGTVEMLALRRKEKTCGTLRNEFGIGDSSWTHEQFV